MTSERRDAEEVAPAPAARPWWHAVLAAVLLLGPLVALEVYLRSQVLWMRPQLRRYPYAMDHKLELARRRPYCPDAVTFGSSLSDRSLAPWFLNEETFFGHEVVDAFDFASAEVRATNMLAQYLWLSDLGCRPALVFIEASPVILNTHLGGATHDPALLSLPRLMAMPDGFSAQRGYAFKDLVELTTLERLFVFRRRGQIQARLKNEWELDALLLPAAERDAAKIKEPWFGRGRERRELDWHGKITRYGKILTAERMQGIKRRRLRQLRKGKLVYDQGAAEVEALWKLVRRAEADGVLVVVHTPPTTSLYRDEVAPKVGIAANFGPLRSELRAFADTHEGVVFVDAWGFDWPLDHFVDWIHTSKRGAKRYVRELARRSRVQGGP